MTQSVAAPAVLRVPAEATFVATVRIFAGALARRVDLDDERTGDLKLAISEVAAEMVAGDDALVGRHLQVEIATDVKAFNVRVRGPAARPQGDAASDHRRRLLDAIVPDAAWSMVGDEQLVEFTLPR